MVGVHLLSLDPLEHEYTLRHVRLDHLRDDEVFIVGQESLDHFGVGCFLDEVELRAQVLLELVRKRSRLKQLRTLGSLLEQLGCPPHERQVELDLILDPGTTNLHDHLSAALEERRVHLGDRGCRERLRVDPDEDVGGEIVRDHALDLREGHREDLVDELAELLDVDIRQQIGPGREQLSELDVGRPELFQRMSELLRALSRRRAAPPDPELAQDAQQAATARDPTDVHGTLEAFNPNAHQGESVRGFRLGNAWVLRADARESGRRPRDEREARDRHARRPGGRRGSGA